MHCNILVLFGSAHSQAMACSEAIAIMTVPKGLSTCRTGTRHICRILFGCKAKKLQLMSGLGWRSGAGSIVSHHADHSLECKLVAI